MDDTMRFALCETRAVVLDLRDLLLAQRDRLDELERAFERIEVSLEGRPQSPPPPHPEPIPRPRALAVVPHTLATWDAPGAADGGGGRAPYAAVTGIKPSKHPRPDSFRSRQVRR
jgi:hypothetical protein